MKKIALFIITLLLLTACGQKKSESTSSTQQQHIEIKADQTTVLYFHSNHRCVTCMAVENTTKEALAEIGNVPFYSIDITLDESKKLMAQYNIAVQTLLVVKGDKQENITSHAFMYARSQPQKVKEHIKQTLEQLQ